MIELNRLDLTFCVTISPELSRIPLGKRGNLVDQHHLAAATARARQHAVPVRPQHEAPERLELSLVRNDVASLEPDVILVVVVVD